MLSSESWRRVLERAAFSLVALLLLTASLAAERFSFNNINYLLLACEWSEQSAMVTSARTVAERTTAERPLAMTSRRRPCERGMDTVEPKSSVLSQTRLATRRINAPKPKGELKWGDGTTIVGTEIDRLSTSNALLNRTTHYLQTGDYGFNIPELQVCIAEALYDAETVLSNPSAFKPEEIRTPRDQITSNLERAREITGGGEDQ